MYNTPVAVCSVASYWYYYDYGYDHVLTLLPMLWIQPYEDILQNVEQSDDNCGFDGWWDQGNATWNKIKKKV